MSDMEKVLNKKILKRDIEHIIEKVAAKVFFSVPGKRPIPDWIDLNDNYVLIPELKENTNWFKRLFFGRWYIRFHLVRSEVVLKNVASFQLTTAENSTQETILCYDHYATIFDAGNTSILVHYWFADEIASKGEETVQRLYLI